MVVAGATPAREDPRRPPLTPSDNSSNAAVVPASRRPRNKEIASRYLSSYSASPSPSPTPSTSGSYSSPSARRFPSPTVSRSAPAPHLRRSSSVDRSRPSTGSTSTTTSSSSTSNSTSSTTTTMTRSLAVSFQGSSFFYQTSRAKPAPTPGRRSLEYSQPNRPWPAAVRSLDYSSTGCSGGIEDKGVNGEVSGSSDTETESVSSGSNSGSQEFMLPPRAKVTSRGICVPARFFQESHGRQRPIRHPSPSKAGSPSPARGMSSPLRGRGGSPAISQANQQQMNAPSILSFAMEVRRAKKGEYRIEEAHLLRLLDNRYLQWRWVNAKFCSAMLDQRQISEKFLYNAWRSMSQLHESVAFKRLKLQLLKQNLKSASILKRQVLYLEEWSELEEEHSSSLVSAIEALKASTLRLPVVGGAQADVNKLKEVTSSALNTFLLMETSNSFLSKVHRTSSLVHQLGEVVLNEHMLMHQCRGLLSTVVALHVKQCSLQGQLLQLMDSLRQEQT